jgi:type I restriction enzyme S subunit
MKPAQLLAHFERISEAPDAVPRLRQFILQLAVRGKLVPQDPSDEPATALLRARRQIPDSRGEPFELPVGWAWSSFSIIGETIGGGTPSKGNPEFWAGSIPWVSPKDMKADFIGDARDHIAEQALEHSSAKLVPPGALLMVVRGMILAHSFPAAISTAPLTINQDMKAVVPFRHELVRMLLLTVKGMKSEILRLVLRSTHGTCKLLTEDLFQLPLPIPPLTEQHRIVTKVDELMGLCDRLEAAQAERESRRDRLVAASLHRLNEPADPPDFREHAQFHLRHLPRLATRPEHVQQQRQTILNLAVRGKLVTQNPNDEPACGLFARIQSMKARQAGSGNSRGRTSSTSPEVEERPFTIPASWAWVRLGDVTISRDGERIPVSKEERNSRAKTYDYYGASGVIDKIDGYLFDKPLLLIGEDGANLINRSTPIAFIARGKYWVNNHAHVLDGISEDFLRYIELFINSIDLKPYVTGTAQPKMNQAKMNGIPVALPPEAEQRRIVAKVDELMALCDRLEAQLATAHSESRRLLEAVLHEALAPPA